MARHRVWEFEVKNRCDVEGSWIYEDVLRQEVVGSVIVGAMRVDRLRKQMAGYVSRASLGRTAVEVAQGP